ncbi:CRTAC1 family protein [Maribacter sp. 2210JD10-5]|uniref:CRTAC1 family protein n=1 Tax=Maribacter sp. 2210JD10-5 TaxID=3386272 RepID=UPI0039BC4C46
MKKIWFLGVSLLLFISCKDKKQQVNETEEMVARLDSLVKNGNPTMYYHWNRKMAQYLAPEFTDGSLADPKQKRLRYWQELLRGGETEKCIEKITVYLKTFDKSYPEILNKETQDVFDLLALAYLRLGEQQNCQNAHSPFSCILPLQKPAIHQLREGSEKAIEVYRMLLGKFPFQRYKWLLNVAYMTLGEHPGKVPPEHLIAFPNWNSEQKDFPRFEEIAMNVGVAENGLSGGACVDDFNGDGLLDIFATSYGMEDQVKLFLNNGKGSFDDATQQSGLIGIVSGLNAIHADYDNDGDNDILVLRGAWFGKYGTHPNSLLQNNGDGTFNDVTKSAGLLSFHPTQTASWGDFDKDGFLDLFIGNEGTAQSRHLSELYRNKGDGTFEEVAKQYGLGNLNKFVKGVDWGDIDNDGWPELYVSILDQNNLLFKNNKGYFKEIAFKADVLKPRNSFPCWFFDVNNDGFQDIFVSGYYTENLHNRVPEDYAKELQDLNVWTPKPKLYINKGDGSFSEKSELYGISKTMYGMGSNYGDLDNDGYLDFYVGTGAPELSTVVPNRMFHNLNGEKFEEVTSAGGFGHIQKGHGVAFADIDQDGDQDIYAVMGGALEGDTFTNVLFENPISMNNWITIQLEGVQTNRSAIGVRLKLVLDNGREIYRTVGTGGSFGASSLQQEIGIGKAQSIKELNIYWLNTKRQVFRNIPGNRKIKIKEGINHITEIPQKPILFQ